MKRHLEAILNSYSEILFLRDKRVGFILLVITLVSPNIAIAGIVATLAAYFFAGFLGMKKEFLNSGFYTYNTLLVGLSVGALFKVSWTTLFFLVALGVLTFLVTIFLFNIFSYFLRLPILSVPFVIVSSLAYLASTRYSGLFVVSLYPTNIFAIEPVLPYWFSGYLKSLGTIFFLPDVRTGLVVMVTLALVSRIILLLSLVGYYSGTIITGLMIGSFEQAFANLSHFNFILIMIALGGIFLVPSLKSYLLALIAVLASTIILDSTQVFWASFGIPAFTLPFNLISLLFIYTLRLLKCPLLSNTFLGTPEKNLDNYLSNSYRFQGEETTINLPFVGEWTIWQGFEGKWTHQGSWKYAYDFIIQDATGKSFRDSGVQLEQYYAFKKPVFSPIRGRVTTVINDLPDNQIGNVDKINNWGNLIIIEDQRGYYIEISHLAHDSIRVVPGEWVEVGATLGLCGNSGYSPQPHIHIQVQTTGAVGAYTLPFSFSSFLEEGIFHANALPQTGAAISPLPVDLAMDRKTTFILDDTCEFDVFRQGKKIDRCGLKVCMASDGTFFWETRRGKLYFGKHQGTFYLYRVEGDDPYLRAIFKALPRLPLAFSKGIKWDDYLTVDSAFGKLGKASLLFFSSFYHQFSQVKGSYEWMDKGVVRGSLKSKFGNFKQETYLELSEQQGIEVVRVGDLELRRV